MVGAELAVSVYVNCIHKISYAKFYIDKLVRLVIHPPKEDDLGDLFEYIS